jgi:hypothetical protein
VASPNRTNRPDSLCQYGCDHAGQWGREVGGHLWRTTGDIEDNCAKMASIGLKRNGAPADARPGGWNDPDMLKVGNGGMNVDGSRTHLLLWALSAPPLLGNDLRQMTPATLAMLRNRQVLAIDQDAPGAQGRAVRKEGAIEVWRKPLADGGVALGVFNRHTQPPWVALSARAARAALARSVARPQLAGRPTAQRAGRRAWRGIAAAVTAAGGTPALSRQQGRARSEACSPSRRRVFPRGLGTPPQRRDRRGRTRRVGRLARRGVSVRRGRRAGPEAMGGYGRRWRERVEMRRPCVIPHAEPLNATRRRT